MTWGRYHDHAPFHRKWIALSNDAVALMWRATQWARSPEAAAAPGFVTRKELRALSGGLSSKRFERVLQELIDAGKPAHEDGLLELRDGGFVIHDFDVYGPPVARDTQQTSNARAEAGRRSAEARRAKYGSARPTPNGGAPTKSPTEQTAEHVHEQTSNKREQARTSAPNKTSNSPEQNFSPDPDPGRRDQPAAAAQDLSGGARVHVREAAAAAPASPDKISCPEDLELKTEQRDELRRNGVADYAIDVGTVRFRGKARTDLTDTRTLHAWHKSLFAAVHGMWFDPRQRPSPPESFNKPGPAKARQPTDEVHVYTMPDGTQVRA